MKKGVRTLLIVLAVLVGLLLLILGGAEIFLNSSRMRKIIDNVAEKTIDGDLNYSKVRANVLTSFPRIKVRLDTVSLTYPHERWAEYDGVGAYSGLLNVGRGEVKDTLASFDRFTIAVNPWKYLVGKLRLSHATLEHPRIFAHQYDSTAANWMMFKSSDKEKSPKDTTEKAAANLPWFSVGPVKLEKTPYLLYTNQKDTLYAHADMRKMLVKGNLKLPNAKKNTPLKFNGLKFKMDSLDVNGRIPADTLGVYFDHLDISNPKRHTLDLDMAVRTLFVSGKFGEMKIPLDLDARASYKEKKDGVKEIDVPRFNADIASMPIKAEALARLYADSTYLKGNVAIKDCDLGKVLDELASGVTAYAQNFSTNAHLTLEADADGYLSDNQIPAINALVKIPSSRITYKPMDLTAKLNLDANGSFSPKKVLDVVLSALEASTDGLYVNANGKGYNLLNPNGKIVAEAEGNGNFSLLSRFIDESQMSVTGPFDLDLTADAYMSELNDFLFDKSSILGHIYSPGIGLVMPPDTVKADLAETNIVLDSSPKGLHADADIDSLIFSKGVNLEAKIRGMVNDGNITRVKSGDRHTPRFAVQTEDERIFLRNGDTRIGVKNTSIYAAAQRRIRDRGHRKHVLDSLKRQHPGIPRDSLIAKERRKFQGRPPREMPDFLQDEAFREKDIHIELGESVVNLLKKWSPSAGVRVAEGFIATPAIPLKTRLQDLNGQYQNDQFTLHNMAVTCGTSDASAKGTLTGIERTLMGHGFLRLNLNMSSSLLNANEFLSAIQKAKEENVGYVAKSETDESFVTDSLENATFDPQTMSVIVVPANLDATVNLYANEVDYSDIVINPLNARVKVAQRCLQLTNTTASTNLGDVEVDAFYATTSRKDIQMGVDLQLKQMSAYDIIHMLPSVDTLMPLLKSFSGDFDCRISATTQLDTNMNVLIPTIDGLIHIAGQNLNVEDAGDLRKITRLLMFRNKNIGNIDDLSVDAVVEKNKLEIYPFILGVDRYKLALMGVQSFDGKMRYNASVVKMPLLPIKFGVNIFGTLDKWKFGIGRSKYRHGNVPEFTTELGDMQINIRQAIRDVFQKGVRNAVAATEKSQANLAQRKKELGYDSSLPAGFLSNKEYQEFDSIMFEEEMKDYNAQIDKEVDDALEEAARATSATDSNSTGSSSK